MKKTLTVVVAVVVMLIIIGGALVWFNRDSDLQPPVPEEQAGPPGEEAPQPDWCPAFEVIAAPGTWESAIDDDPINPHANPNSLMLKVTRPLQDQFAPEDVKVWTLPYTAQFRNINALQEMSYDDSREEGRARMEQELQEMHQQCPQTGFLLTGFSQGAVIAGDVASVIGSGEGVIPPENIRGVALISDGRREQGVGENVGTPTAGVGAEIALHPLNAVVQPVIPGATMRGVRAGGFGALDDRVKQICAPDDAVCDAPSQIGNALERAQEMAAANGVHAMYATNPDAIPGTVATDWVVGWATDIINQH